MGSESNWSMVVKLCDSWKASPVTLYCKADADFLCITCDSKIHSANKLDSRHARVWMCEVCEQSPTSVTCKADAVALWITCDRDIHSVNPLAHRHERIPVIPFHNFAAAKSGVSGEDDVYDGSEGGGGCSVRSDEAILLLYPFPCAATPLNTRPHTVTPPTHPHSLFLQRRFLSLFSSTKISLFPE